jgi:5'-3' exonuclease
VLLRVLCGVNKRNGGFASVFGLAGDLVDLASIPLSFRLGSPFLPFQQLLGCLPASSAGFLPPCYRELMTSLTSPLLRFYPDVASIKVDMNGQLIEAFAEPVLIILMPDCFLCVQERRTLGRELHSFRSLRNSRCSQASFSFSFLAR